MLKRTRINLVAVVALALSASISSFAEASDAQQPKPGTIVVLNMDSVVGAEGDAAVGSGKLVLLLK